MRYLLAVSVPMWLALVSVPARAELCVQQDYSNPAKAPDFDCPGPGESALVPVLSTRPSLGVVKGTVLTPPGKRRFTLDYDGVLMGRNKTIELGLKVKAVRRLRWLGMHKDAAALSIEKKYLTSVWEAKVTLRDSQVASYKQQLVDARKQRDSARAWYRRFSTGLIVGIVTTAAAAVAIAIVAK